MCITFSIPARAILIINQLYYTRSASSSVPFTHQLSITAYHIPPAHSSSRHRRKESLSLSLVLLTYILKKKAAAGKRASEEESGATTWGKRANSASSWRRVSGREFDEPREFIELSLGRWGRYMLREDEAAAAKTEAKRRRARASVL